MKKTLIYGTATAAVTVAAIAGLGLAGCNRNDPAVEAVYGPPPMESDEPIEDVYGPPADFTSEPEIDDAKDDNGIKLQPLETLYGVPLPTDALPIQQNS